MAKKQTKTGGRKAGTPNNEFDVVDATVSQCSKCLSTDRKRYFKKQSKELPPNHSRRPLFTHLVLRSTQCAKCGQWRWDKTYENGEGWSGLLDCEESDERAPDNE